MEVIQWIRNKFHLFLSLSILVGIGFGIQAALNSPLFTLEAISIESTDHGLGLSDAAVLQLVQIPVGKISLFALDLDSIKKKLLTSDWIAQVQLEKKLPNSLSILVSYRKPKAFMQTKAGILVYLDEDGNQFGVVDLMNAPDLPLVSGQFERTKVSRVESPVKSAVNFINQWEAMALNRVALISSLYFEPNEGFKALVTYPMDQQKVTAMIHLGQDIDTHLDVKFFQFLKVFQYLSKNSIASHQIRADVGKKVVVKTVEGS